MIASVVLNRSVNSVRGNRELGFRYNNVTRSGTVVVSLDILMQTASKLLVLRDCTCDEVSYFMLKQLLTHKEGAL
jgi:hypothetical protein